MPRSGNFDLVLGCTGRNSFTFRDVHLAGDRPVLASASSADVEFGRAEFVEAADRFPDDEITVIEPDNARASGLHAPLAIQTSTSQILTFLNADFPVNFDGGPEGLALVMIQPTRVYYLPRRYRPPARQIPRSGAFTRRWMSGRSTPWPHCLNDDRWFSRAA